ncbi:hypothetical protein [Baaleninema sp.]|uniref:hypothetical protein n=1 Tax=Baaleninema sp. TaxID=3101197 RepID=UPI003CFF789A
MCDRQISNLTTQLPSQEQIDRVIQLLDSWCEDTAENIQEQQETFEYLQKAIDEDRPSDRKIFL